MRFHFSLSVSESRLLRQHVEVAPEALQTYYERLRDPATCRAALAELQAKTGVLQAVQEGLKSIAPVEQAAIDANLQRLSLTIAQSGTKVPDALGALRATIAEPDAAFSVPTLPDVGRFPSLGALPLVMPGVVPPNPLTSPSSAPAAQTSPTSSGTAPKADESWIPSNMDFKQWTTKQRIAVSAGTLGLGLLAAFLLMKKNEKGGWGKAILAVTGLAAVGAGISWLYSRFKGIDDLTAKAKELEEAARQKLEDAKKMAKDALHNPLGREGEEYGLSHVQYEEAKTLYRTHGKDRSRPRIAALFGLHGAETNPKFEALMKHLDERYTPEAVDGIKYSRASVAFENYEENIAEGYHVLERWVMDHSGELAIGTTIGAAVGSRVPVLRKIFMSGLSFTAKMAGIAAQFAQWGLTKHPFATLFVMAGSIATWKLTAKDSLKLPENIPTLCLANAENKAIALGALGELGDKGLQELKDFAKLFELEDETYSQWLQRKMGEFAAYLDEHVPETIGLTPEELIEKNNRQGIGQLRDTLESRLRTVRQDSTLRESDEALGEKLENALEALEAFEEAFIKARSGTEADQAASMEMFALLKTALADPTLSITLEVQDGFVRWNSPDIPHSFDLCIDPAITDKDQAHDLSGKLRQNESPTSFLMSNALDQIREMEQKGMDTAYGTLTNSKGMAMVVGNFLYVVEDWRNAKNYVMVPLDLALDAIGVENPVGGMTKSRNWTEWGANVTTGFISCSMFTLTAGILAKLKRVVIGGGPMYRGATRLIVNMTPGLSQMNMAVSMWEGVNDARLVKRFGLFHGRRLNNALAHAKIRPEWISILETGNIDDVRGVADLADVSLSKSTDLPTLRGELREALQRQLRVTERRWADIPNKLKRSGWKIWQYPSAFGGKEIAYEKELYNLLMVDYASVDDLTKAGHTLEELVQAGMKVEKLLGAGVSVADLLTAKVPLDDLVKAGADVGDLLRAAQSVEDLLKAGVGVDRLLAAGVDEAWLLSSGVTQQAIDQAKNAVKNVGGGAAKFIDNIIKDKRIVTAMGKAGTGAAAAEQAIRAELDALEPRTLNMIEQSGRAKKLLAGAVASGKPVEINRIVTAARRAAMLKVAWNGVGAAGDLYGIYIAFCDYEANQERIGQTDNPELKALYEQANMLAYAEGTTSAAGLLLGGVAIYHSLAAGNALIVALGAPAGMVMLPIAAVTFGARMTYKKCEESSEYHLLSARDLQKKYTPGKILEHIGKSTQLENVNFVQDFFVNAEAATAANNSARYTGYRAYFAQVAAERIPRPVPLDIEPEKREECEKEDAAKGPRPDGEKTAVQTELDRLYAEDISAFVNATNRYIAYKTQNTFELVSPEVLRNAALYGEIQFEQLGRTGEADYKAWNDTAYWEDIDRQIAVRSQASLEAITRDLSEYASKPEVFEQEAPYKMLFLLRDELAECEQRFLGTDFSNWQNTPNWGLTNWYSDADMQMIARGVIIEGLFQELRKGIDAVRSTKTFSTIDFTLLRQRLEDTLKRSPDDCAKKGMAAPNVSYLRLIGEQSSQLSMYSLLQMFGSSSGQSPDAALGHEAGQREKMIAGTDLMKRIDANNKGSYFTKQYGFIGNQFLYMAFDTATNKWLANFGSLDNLRDPSTFSSSNRKFAELLKELDAINTGRSAEQLRRAA